MRQIVVIGANAAGMMAAISAAHTDRNAQVTVIAPELVFYRRPGIPSLIAGFISDPCEIQIFSKQTFARHKINFRKAVATGIDAKSKTIIIQADGKKDQLCYDAAVIATGGRPSIPKIQGADKKGVCTFTTFEAAAEIIKVAEKADTAVVIGAGFIALEIAEALMHRGLDVYFNVRSRILRRLLEPQVSEFLSCKFNQQDLRMLTGEAISEIGGNDRVEYVTHKGKRISTNLVVIGTGVKPNVTLAEKCGIELGTTGAVKVDSRMQTSIADIYAAGDCAESPDLHTGLFVYSPVGSIGASAGKMAGCNAAGGNALTKGFLRAQVDHILGMQIFSIGHSSTTAKETNLPISVHDLYPPQQSKGFAATKPFDIAVLLTDSNAKIVGAQLVARYFGSQYAWQLYQAVQDAEDRREFLQRFNSPRTKIADAMVQTIKSLILVETPGQDNSVRWENATVPKNKS